MSDTTVKRFYDIETFKNLFLIVWQDSTWEEYQYGELRNPTGMELADFIVSSNLVGFFNHGFDDIVLATILNRLQSERAPMNKPINPMLAYEIAQELINNETDRYFGGLEQPTEDIMKFKDNDTSLPLKGFENVLMMDIMESQFPFDEPLSPAGIISTVKYCRHDVLATRRTYNFMKDRGNVESLEVLRRFVAESLNIDEDRLMKSGTNSMMIKLLKAPSYNRKDFFDYIERGNFTYAFSDPEFVKWYEKMIIWADDKLKLEPPTLEFERNEVNYKFALGGGHGHNIRTMFEKVFGRDFESLYPMILIAINGLGDIYTSMFKDIVYTRLAAKKTNKSLAAGLKLAVNSLYGLTRSEKSGAQIYNKYLGLDIIIAGQVILYDLALRLEELNATLVNINTDGILYVCDEEDEQAIDDMSNAFAKRVEINLDLEYFPHYRAEHVNSYFCFKDELDPKKENDSLIIKKKGSFAVKPFSNNLATPYYVENYFIDQELGIGMPTWEEMFEKNKLDFICRAKNTKQFEFSFGYVEEYERYHKTSGKPLPKKGIDFIPLFIMGKQFRGYATNEGYALRNYNVNTQKFVEIGALATKKYPTNFLLDCDSFDDINLDYYATPASEMIQQISSNRVSKK